MIKRKSFFKVIACGSLFFATLVILNTVSGRSRMGGKYRRVSSLTRLNSVLNDNDLLVVLFYLIDRSMSKQLKRETKFAVRTMVSASKIVKYRYAGVSFASTKIGSDNFTDMSKQYGFPAPKPNIPTVALFKGGKMVSFFSGFPSINTLSKQIDTHFKEEMAKNSKERDRERARQLQRARIRSYNRAYWSPYMYGGYGWPYRGYGYWGRPYGGFGFGFGWRGGFGRGWGGGRSGCRGRCR